MKTKGFFLFSFSLEKRGTDDEKMHGDFRNNKFL